jgi:hypothetical protein
MADDSDRSTRGSCLCGSVQYTVSGPLRPVWQCHCVRCKKITGNFMAASGAPAANISVDQLGALTWFRPEDDRNVAYAFCQQCGSSLFWRTVDQDPAIELWSICAGTLDDDAGLGTEAVWFSDQAAAHTNLDPHAQHFPSTNL